jgi:lipoyl-dependent peroxiredoxin
MKDLYTPHVHVTSGRNGSATSSDGRLQLQLGFPKELAGDGTKTNPEQLFLAGYAARFASSVSAAAKQLSAPVNDVRIDAQGTLSLREDGSYIVSRVALKVHGLGERAGEVLADAKRICAYSNATRGNTVIDVAAA